MASATKSGSESSGRLTTADFFPEFSHDRLKASRVSRRNFSVLRMVLVVCICLFISFVPSLLVINLRWMSGLNQWTSADSIVGTCGLMEGLHVTCFPEFSSDVIIEQSVCEQRGCCFRRRRLAPDEHITECFHSLPSSHTLNISQQMNTNNDDSNQIPLVESHPNNAAFWSGGNANRSLRLDWINDEHLVMDFSLDDISNSDVDFNRNSGNISVSLGSESYARLDLKVERRVADEYFELFDASLGPMILSESMSELTLLLGSDIVFGLPGLDKSVWRSNSTSSSSSFKTFYPLHNDGSVATTEVAMVAADQSLNNFFGLRVTSTSPLHVEALGGLKRENSTNRALLTLRSMGGDLGLHVFTGPQPLNVLAAMNKEFNVDTLTNYAQWMVGHTVCPVTTSDFDELLSDMLDVVPFDASCLSEGLFRTLFQAPSDIEALERSIERLKRDNKKYVMALPPYVSVTSNAYKDYQFSDFFVQLANASSGHFEALVEGERVVFPDYSVDNKDFVEWFSSNFEEVFHSVRPDGIMLVHNYPRVDEQFEACNATNDHLYVPPDIADRMSLNSICPNALHPLHESASHLEMHNEYARHQIRSVNRAIKLPIVSSDTMADVHRGSLARVHPSTWQGLRASLGDAMDLSMSGRSLVAVSGCGNDDEADLDASNVDELCLRYYQMASLMPGGLISLAGSRLPHNLSGTFTDWVAKALQQRYRLTPYLRLLLHHHLRSGQPLLAPMAVHFPWDEEARLIDTAQFMLGHALVVVPVLEARQSEDEDNDQHHHNVMLDVYLPSEQDAWYDLWSGQRARAGWQRVPDVPYQTRIFARAGNIIPALEWASSSALASVAEYNVSVIAALHCSPPRSGCEAKGQMVLDQMDTELTTDFVAEASEHGGILMQTEVIHSCISTVVDSLIVYGLDTRPKYVTIMDEEDIDVGQSIDDVVYFDEDNKRLHARDLGIDICQGNRITFEWFYDDDHDDHGSGSDDDDDEDDGSGSGQ